MTDFAATRAQFHIPEGVIYLDGNSLGPMPVAAEARAAQAVREEWGEMLIGGWNKAGWMAMPRVLGRHVGRLIGAEPGTVVIGDTLSIKVYQALAAALAMRPERRVVLSDSGNFPTDLYMAQGLIKSLGQDHELRIVAPEEVEAAIDEDIAVVMLTEVDYRTGRLHDMAAISARAQAAGALTVWDLAHSAGALPIDLAGSGADFAAGCTYKYLNAGPGAPAFIYVAPRHSDMALPALSGWLGHAAPFAFEQGYRPGEGIDRMRVGTPPVLQMAALEAALGVWDGVSMTDIRARSIELSELFIAEVESRCPQLALASPRDPLQRGSQVSFRFEESYAAVQALIARGVVGDFRAPDIMRFGIAPLYIGEDEIRRAALILQDVMENRLWDDPTYRARAAVT
ncbi:kynureninase [Rhodovulum sulfidophilum]|uniref:kynureninase n=1 Tax=Rhodovulum sulfidophilum TaxID=35806 RepID=UPI0005A7825E|nr:kynureninase [Rhodovulum sulfidophilum]ANB35321.1 kynureninase [Rhodovulum sulfidophilum DSM 1374]ANB39143.1 kynureninase [Rhodovulum sulfidophilum]MCW2303846.1 kynureninase [Rhodovulum sulfidophilum]